MKKSALVIAKWLVDKLKIENLEEESQKFNERDRVPTGLLSGKRVKNSEGLAYEIEKEYEENTGEDGARRFAWVFLDRGRQRKNSHFSFR